MITIDQCAFGNYHFVKIKSTTKSRIFVENGTGISSYNGTATLLCSPQKKKLFILLKKIKGSNNVFYMAIQFK